MSTPAHELPVHPGILELIEETLEDDTVADVNRFIALFNEDITSIPPKLARDARKPDATNDLKALYTGGTGGETIAHGFGFSTLSAYQAAFRRALLQYQTNRNAPTTEVAATGTSGSIPPVNIPDLLGVKCFSLRAMGTGTATEFDKRIMATHHMPTHHFFMRMSSSSKGMVVLVEKTTTGLLQHRFALICKPSESTSTTRFRLEEIMGGDERIAQVNAAISENPNAPIAIGGGEFIIPITKNIGTILAGLGDANANPARAKQCFADLYTSHGLTPFNASGEEAASSHASGSDAYAAYTSF